MHTTVRISKPASATMTWPFTLEAPKAELDALPARIIPVTIPLVRVDSADLIRNSRSGECRHEQSERFFRQTLGIEREPVRA